MNATILTLDRNDAATSAPENRKPSEIILALQENGWLPWKQRQHDSSVCLAPLLEALGWKGDARQLCDALPQRYFREFDLLDLRNTMASLGYESQATEVRISEIGTALLPCLFMPKDSRRKPLVLMEHRGEEGWLCFDAGRHLYHCFTDDAVEGTLYHFTKIQNSGEEVSEAQARQRIGYTWFRGVMERFGGAFWQISLLCIVVNLFALAVPIFVMMVYDKVIGAHSMATLPYLLAGVSIAIATEMTLRLTRVKLLSWLGARINILVSTSLFERLLYLSPRYTESASVSAQLARVKAFETVRDFFAGPMFLTLLELPFVSIIILAIALVAGPLMWVTIGVMFGYVMLLMAMRWQMKLSIYQSARLHSQRQQAAVEIFSKLDALKYNGVTETLLQRFYKLTAQTTLAGFRSAFQSSILENFAQALTLLASVITVVYGVELIWQGQLSVGALVGTMILTWRALSPLQSVCVMVPRLVHILSSIQQVNSLMTLSPEREAIKPDLVYRPFRGEVQFNNVTLRYTRSTDPVFTALSFEAKPGQLVAITGGNGSGKSSVLKLLNGLYAPQLGNIRIDGVDIRQLDPVALRRQISYLSQHPDFFSGTLLENMRLVSPTATQEEIREALRQADAWNEVQQLSSGINTRIGAGYTQLSAGLAYRLNLARLYLKQENIILCDELPYSLLNSHAGELFKAFLRGVRGTHTVLMVTHRSDYLQMADTIVQLEMERRPLIGTPAQLMKGKRV